MTTSTQDMAPYRDWPQANPPPFPADQMELAKAHLRELSQTANLLGIATAGANGAPAAGTVTFHARMDEDRPIYFFGARAAGIEPPEGLRPGTKMSVTIFTHLSFEERRQLKSGQIQGRASLVEDAQTLDALAAKGLVSPIVQFTPEFVSWHDMSLTPPRGAIVFGGA